MTNLIKISTAVLTLFAGSGLAFAIERPFSFGQGEKLEFGTQKKETYEVAFRLEPGFFEGGKVTKINVPVKEENISNVKLWLTNELTVELVDGKNITVPDILELQATVTDGIAEATLPEPFIIPGSGLYVGYSFDVDKLVDGTKWPLLVSASTAAEGFYLRTSRSYREWQNLSQEYKVATELAVTIDYDFAQSSVELVSIKGVRANYGKPFTVPAVIENHGYDPVTSIDFEYEFGEAKGTTHYELPEALPAIYGRRMNLDLPFESCDVKFNHPLEVTVTKVNGMGNADKSPSATGSVNIVTHTVRHRVVMEEYTGTWCGFCVKGTAAVERMLKLYPDDFIPIVIHGGGKDPMVTLNVFPNFVSGYPHSWIDRAFDCDPYDGLYWDEFFGIEKTFLERQALPAPADIDVTAELDENFNVNVSATVNFVEIPDNEFKLAYALLEDGMKGDGPNWAQSNYYASNKPEQFIPEMERFCTGSSYMVGIEFNEVLVMAPDIMGVEGSVNFTDTDTPIIHDYVFPDVRKATNVYGQPVIQDTGKLSVVALLIDTSDGHIANAAKFKLSDTGSVNSIGSENREVKEVVWMNCDGRVISEPVKGVNIKTTKYTDGTSTVEKIIMR